MVRSLPLTLNKERIMRWLVLLLMLIPLAVFGNVDLDDDVTIDGPLLVKETIEAFQDIETFGAFVGPDADIDEIKQWIPYTVVFGAEQGRAYPDTVSKARDVFAFVAPVAGDIAHAVLFVNNSGGTGDSLTVDITIEDVSVFTTDRKMKMVPACGAKESPYTCGSGRGAIIDPGADDCSAGEVVELDLDTYGAFSPYPDGVIVTVYFAPNH